MRNSLLRVKGMLDIAGVDGPVVVQGVHHVLNAPVELDAWPIGDAHVAACADCGSCHHRCCTRKLGEALPIAWHDACNQHDRP